MGHSARTALAHLHNSNPQDSETVAETKRRFGTDHQNYAVALNNLARIRKAQAEYGEAEGLYQQALAIMKMRSVKNIPT